MPTTNAHLSRALRRALLALTAPALAVSATAVLAQDAGDIEEVVATGTRLARDPNLEGAQPVTSIDSEAIQLSGEYSLADVVNDVPALLFSVTAEQSADDTQGVTAGGNVLNLRGLGIDRTLTLVNGRRHVGGVQGSSAVDIGSIPAQLVERVEVLTGGASAVYGADAVTGVVNFILKDDFEGFRIDGRFGTSTEIDGQQSTVQAVFGKNFASGRGNVTLSFDYARDEGLQFGDRPNAVRGTGGDWVNPALRFQQGDISAGSTPNFAQFFNFAETGLTNFGLPIPTADDFIADYTDTFGAAPTLTNAELALIDRAANAPQRAVLPELTFPFTSGYGYVIPGNPFTFDGFDPETAIDLNGNGTPDCLDSFTGYNSVFGAASFGVVGGCWVSDAAGNYSVVQDGQVAGDFQGFGGSSFDVYNQDYFNVVPPDERIAVNLLSHFDISPSASLFFEGKYVTQNLTTPADPNSFWDLLFGAADNPFLPDFIQPIADATGGVATTVDPLAFQSRNGIDRETIRLVGGVEGELPNGWGYEAAVNYGRYEENIQGTNRVINDRFFAAIDAVIDPATGQPACRSSVDAGAPALNTPFQIPAYEEGYFTFTPGDGQCVPLNIWAGATGFTQEALDFVTTDIFTDLVIEQVVVSAVLTGDSGGFALPGGPIQFAFGAEYRDESSEATFDNFQLGLLPEGSPAGAGTFIGDISDNTSLVFRPQLQVGNETGSYDVTDVFLEASAPLVRDRPGVKDFTVGGAVRYSSYSTIGDTLTYSGNVVYAPVDSFSVRGTYGRAVRAPNVTELFSPVIGTTFRPDDPCDAAQLTALRETNPGLADEVQANCVIDLQSIGLDPFENGVYSFSDPLSASFGGVTRGNPDLQEETSDSFTVGFVFQPSFAEGLTLTFDYWDYSIEDAVALPTAQDTVDGCYPGVGNPTLCSLFTRNDDPNSAQFGGLNSLDLTRVNFAAVETSGFDFSGSYDFAVGRHAFNIRLQGSYVNEIDFFENPADLTQVNPELGEIQRPELSGNIFFNWAFENFQFGWQTQYLGEQLPGGVEVETAESLYGPDIFRDPVWIHDLSAAWNASESIRVYGGVRNIFDEDPFITQAAFPVSPRGRFVFLGLDYQM
ncbi:MAG: TonB-dependent receptor [Pseudomonadota bacterium]